MHFLSKVKLRSSLVVILDWAGGMALGLAQAGCDIVGINIVEPTETIKQVTALGRRF